MTVYLPVEIEQFFALIMSSLYNLYVTSDFFGNDGINVIASIELNA